MTTEASNYSDPRMGSGPEKCRQLPEAKRDKEIDFPLEPQEEPVP